MLISTEKTYVGIKTGVNTFTFKIGTVLERPQWIDVQVPEQVDSTALTATLTLDTQYVQVYNVFRDETVARDDEFAQLLLGI